MRKIVFGLAALVLLSSACLPQINLPTERTHSSHLATIPIKDEGDPSLLAPAESDRFINRSGEVQEAFSSPLYNMMGVKPSYVRPEPPISEESNEDFNLEIFPPDDRADDRAKKEPDFDIPIVINEKVEQFIQFFQTTLRNRFSSWLARSGKYIPFMTALLRDNGLPEDLVYMSLIESGFNPYAYSRSKASGPWQFIYFTGKRYGLKADWWVDERRDPEKSTIAAAKYLKDLYDMFACWYLAAAGYNAGENKIAAGMKRYRTEDFWELSKHPFLKQETKDYVPQMIAAALIAKDPEAYGITGIEYEEPLQYEKVMVPPLTDLAAIAKACEVPLEELRDLNPELLRRCTPPESDYEIKIPNGKREAFLKDFEALPPSERLQYRVHVVRKGEGLPGIARAYRVSSDSILATNQMKKGTRLAPGTNLLIPAAASIAAGTKVASGARKRDEEKGHTFPSRDEEEVLYTIKKGDTLWSIANEMGVNLGALSRWNNLHPEKKLQPGNKLKIKLLPSPAPSLQRERQEIVYEVRDGDTLWAIAKKYNLSVSEIRQWNRLDESDRIHPAIRLKLRVGGVRPSTLN